MKKLLLSLAALTVLATYSCSDGGNKTGNTDEKKEAAENTEELELKGFMVGGMYFYNGYGGVAATERQVAQYGSSKEDVINGYREVFVFPFRPEDSVGAKGTLSEGWGIKTREDFLRNVEKLKAGNAENPHKAWDYARLTNNTCIAYSAGFVTKEEAKKIIAENLVATQKQFKTWDDFLKDFNEGRKTWNPESSDMGQFTRLTAEMLTRPEGLYKLLPLNK